MEFYGLSPSGREAGECDSRGPDPGEGRSEGAFSIFHSAGSAFPGSDDAPE
jgi:hypothetical protein